MALSVGFDNSTSLNTDYPIYTFPNYRSSYMRIDGFYMIETTGVFTKPFSLE